MSRKQLIAGNWKLHNTLSESVALARTVREGAANAKCEVAIAPALAAARVPLNGGEWRTASRRLKQDEMMRCTMTLMA